MWWAGCEAGSRAATVVTVVGCPELVQQPFGHFAMNLEQRRDVLLGLFPLERTELSDLLEIRGVLCQHDEPVARRTHCNQCVIGQARTTNLIVAVFRADLGQHLPGQTPVPLTRDKQPIQFEELSLCLQQLLPGPLLTGTH